MQRLFSRTDFRHRTFQRALCIQGKRGRPIQCVGIRGEHRQLDDLAVIPCDQNAVAALKVKRKQTDRRVRIGRIEDQVMLSPAEP